MHRCLGWLSFPLVALVLLGPLSLARGDELFPYRAYVTADEVNLRSGPGDHYYPVMKLSRGDSVDVYRHDPGGWYAIRPPAGSYSWVASEFIRPTEGDEGIVIADRVVARVGSQFSDIKDVIQVRLEQGETVRILEAQRVTDREGLKTWYKIASPRGEFRWVSGRYLEPESRWLATSQRTAEPARNPTTKPAVTPARDKGTRDVTILERKIEELQAELLALKGREGIQPELNDDPVRPRTVPPLAMSVGNLPQSLELMELELSEMITADTILWDFRSLTARTEQALALAESTPIRNRARALLAKIERFEDIRQRYSQVVAQRNSLQRDVRPAVPTADAQTGPPRYDGMGRLAQVVAQKTGAPQFALLDEEGRVRSYVTAAPGVNLRPYLGRDVGVTGIIGYLPDQAMRHVTAKRIEELDASRLR